MSLNLHRNWEPVAPEITGKFYFSGTVSLGGVSLSFEPQSIRLNVVQKEDELKAIFRDTELALAAFEGRWLGPEPEGVTWE